MSYTHTPIAFQGQAVDLALTIRAQVDISRAVDPMVEVRIEAGGPMLAYMFDASMAAVSGGRAARNRRLWLSVSRPDRQRTGRPGIGHASFAHTLALSLFVLASCAPSGPAPMTRQEEPAAPANSQAEEPPAPVNSQAQEPAPSVGQPAPAAPTALEAYRAAVEAFNRGDAEAYFAAYADRLRCFYARSDVSRADVERLRRPALAAAPSADPAVVIGTLRVVREDPNEVVLVDIGSYRGQDGERRPHQKAVLLVRRDGTYRIAGEAGSANLCYTELTGEAPPRAQAPRCGEDDVQDRCVSECEDDEWSNGNEICADECTLRVRCAECREVAACCEAATTTALIGEGPRWLYPFLGIPAPAVLSDPTPDESDATLRAIAARFPGASCDP